MGNFLVEGNCRALQSLIVYKQRRIFHVCSYYRGATGRKHRSICSDPTCKGGVVAYGKGDGVAIVVVGVGGHVSNLQGQGMLRWRENVHLYDRTEKIAVEPFGGIIDIVSRLAAYQEQMLTY